MNPFLTPLYHCVNCGQFLGVQNPRQYCKKIMCPEEKITLEEMYSYVLLNYNAHVYDEIEDMIKDWLQETKKTLEKKC